MSVNNKSAVNLTSLDMIKDELMSTLEVASTHLETFIAERDNLKVLESCIESLEQVHGSLSLVQLHGAIELSQEILQTARQIRDGVTKGLLDSQLSTLTEGFFVLSCYFEYTQQHGIGMPVLLLRYINDIRASKRESLLPESYFELIGEMQNLPISDQLASLPETEELATYIRRTRHMYQVALLDVLKGGNVVPSLGLMQRSTNKIQVLAQGRESERLWHLASVAFESLAAADMPLNSTRKRLFSHIDKQFRLLERAPEESLNTTPDQALFNELAYFIGISGVESESIQPVVSALDLDRIAYTDELLQKELVALTGPSANTVQSVADVLRLEINLIKENIEQIQQEKNPENGMSEIVPSLQKIKDILSVVGLTSASQVLQDPYQKLQDAQEGGGQLSDEDSLLLADALLYVESVLSSLERKNFSREKLAEINNLTQTEVISTSHLQDAQIIVMDQAEASIVSIKNALTQYTDSSYDSAYLKDIDTQLDEIRGSFLVLTQVRAANIVDSCRSYIQQLLEQSSDIPALKQQMEIFADALICLEYYLGRLKVDKNVSAETLTVAEESLTALGFPIKLSS